MRQRLCRSRSTLAVKEGSHATSSRGTLKHDCPPEVHLVLPTAPSVQTSNKPDRFAAVMKIRRNSQVIWDLVDGVTVLCNTDSVEYFHLNGTGAMVWDFCEDNTLGDTVKHLHYFFPDGDRDVVAAHVNEFLESLKAANLILMEGDEIDDRGS
jgi:Coenzyme PQQ synthesis protein D (PqqD)